MDNTPDNREYFAKWLEKNRERLAGDVTSIDTLRERMLLPNEVWPAMSSLITEHIGLYGKMVERGIHPNLAKSAIADLCVYNVGCCKDKEALEKLLCPTHLVAWLHAESIQRLYKSIELADATYKD